MLCGLLVGLHTWAWSRATEVKRFCVLTAQLVEQQKTLHAEDPNLVACQDIILSITLVQ